MASPAYLTATPGNVSNGSFVNTNSIAVTPLVGKETSFYVIRHAAYNTFDSTNYRLTIPTSKGSMSIPQLSSTLTLNGRDSKIHVADYDVGGMDLLYSSAEIFTWKSYGNKKVLILYGGPKETHEAAFVTNEKASLIEGSGVQMQTKKGSLVINWPVTPTRKVVQIGEDLTVYLLDRNTAYNYWVLDAPGQSPVIISGGYLLRTAAIDDKTLSLTGDFNETTSIEIVGAPSCVSELCVNGKTLATKRSSCGALAGQVNYNKPKVSLPNLKDLEWKYVDSLPEIQPGYDDSRWTNANLKKTQNPRTLTTPTSLYSSDYGFNAGNLLFRGHFKATGGESTFMLRTQGGTAFGHSVWLNKKFVGSWKGISVDTNYNQTLTLPKLKAGESAVLTILVDNMGYDEEFVVGSNTMKSPRGILSYSLAGHNPSDISWKIQGNLGGEDYLDKARGPLNAGGLYAERQGYYLPNPPSGHWASSKPTDGIKTAGVGFYTTSFDLDLPAHYDIPLSFQFTNTTMNGAPVDYRVQLYVNGYQFGKYGKWKNPSLLSRSPLLTYLRPVNNIGPQQAYPVPEGILNYHGTNYVALSLWALDAAGARVQDVQLVSTAIIQSGYGKVELSPMPAYTPRAGAY